MRSSARRWRGGRSPSGRRSRPAAAGCRPAGSSTAPSWGRIGRTDADAIRRTTRRCLEVADDLGARSLALPAFGTGVGGFPLGECAQIMARVARAYEARSLERVVFAVVGDEARRAFESAVAAA